MIVNLCFLAPPRTNVGDRFTHPVDYFSWEGLGTQKYALGTPSAIYLRSRPSMIVIGGGGVVRHPKRNDWITISRVAAETPRDVPVVVWGMGINDYGRLDTLYDGALDFIESRPNVLVGLRDRFHRNYVPCASCMRPEFDHVYELQREVGVYTHESFEIPLDFPQLSNRFEGDPELHLRTVLSFLGSSEYVITNSYHGAYWATLLGRKVIVVNPLSNKFLGLWFEPVIVQDVRFVERHLPYLKRACCRYEQALIESRALTTAFAHSVTALLRNPQCLGT